LDCIFALISETVSFLAIACLVEQGSVFNLNFI